MGVASGPFNAIVFFLTIRQWELGVGRPEAIASSGIAVLPSFRMGVTSTGSHLIGHYTVIVVLQSVLPLQLQRSFRHFRRFQDQFHLQGSL